MKMMLNWSKLGKNKSKHGTHIFYMSAENDPPWEVTHFVSLENMPLPPLILEQKGWIEQDHTNVIQTKVKIEKTSSVEEWELRKKIINPYEAIFSNNDDTFPCVAKVEPLSRSYFKMVEMLDICGFWELVPTQFQTAHICEGPGGFIQCVIEKSKEKQLECSNVHAMTLKPTKSNIPGWRRSIGFLRKHPEIHLEGGADGTGNVLIPANQKYFCKKAAGSFLFTADGGFDFSVDYEKQEQVSFHLVLASFLIGFQSLAIDGIMIIKLFDIYSPATQDLLLGSASFFKEFMLYKPATSRPCNAERYFIGVGYKGEVSARPWIQHLQQAFEKHPQSPLTRLVKTIWPEKLIKLLQEQIQWQEKLQIQSIQTALQLQKKDIPQLISKNIATSSKWCDFFQVPK
jgi:23S rRNA U2552 (ribose-2'-O)-methylase RlmE/FtsJ